MPPSSAAPFAVPDPYLPIGRSRRAHGGQQLRRERICAAIRRRLARGETAIPLRALAAECGLSHQTVANLAGTGPGLLHAAMADYMAALGQLTMHHPAPNAPLAWADICWQAACFYPDYIKYSTLAHYGFDPAMTRSLYDKGSRSLMVSLLQMQRAGLLRRSFDCWAFASCVAALTPSLTHAWLHHAFDLDGLRIRLGNGIGTMLLDGASTSHAGDIQLWLAGIRTTDRPQA